MIIFDLSIPILLNYYINIYIYIYVEINRKKIVKNDISHN